MFDIYGHFGSHLSYATVGANVARALNARGLLGRVTNFDDEWLPEYADLNYRDKEGTHVLLMTDASGWLVAACSKRYGAQNVGIFMSPNTTRLSGERAHICSEVGMVLTPSQWCTDTVLASLKDLSLEPPTWLVRVPLGVSRRYLSVPTNRSPSRGGLRFLHLGTDFTWPGRKGTAELLSAWGILEGAYPDKDWMLTVHVPLPMYEQVHYQAHALDLDRVRIVSGPERGTTDEELAVLYEQADVVVLPARCEGFGMMMLAACVAKTPLLAPYVTGQVEFMSIFDGWLGIPVSTQYAPLEREPGEAPVIEARTLATSLLAASSPAVLEHLRAKARAPGTAPEFWCWDHVVGEWVDTLERWRTG